MYFGNKTMREVERLSKDEKFSYIFDKMLSHEDPAPPEVLRGIAEAFSDELGLSSDSDVDKLAFVLRLAAYAAKGKE